MRIQSDIARYGNRASRAVALSVAVCPRVPFGESVACFFQIACVSEYGVTASLIHAHARRHTSARRAVCVVGNLALHRRPFCVERSVARDGVRECDFVSFDKICVRVPAAKAEVGLCGDGSGFDVASLLRGDCRSAVRDECDCVDLLPFCVESRVGGERVREINFVRKPDIRVPARKSVAVARRFLYRSNFGSLARRNCASAV